MPQEQQPSPCVSAESGALLFRAVAAAHSVQAVLIPVYYVCVKLTEGSGAVCWYLGNRILRMWAEYCPFRSVERWPILDDLRFVQLPPMVLPLLNLRYVLPSGSHQVRLLRNPVRAVHLPYVPEQPGDRCRRPFPGFKLRRAYS